MSLASNETINSRFKIFIFLALALILSACNSGGGGDNEAGKTSGASECVMGSGNVGDCVLS